MTTTRNGRPAPVRPACRRGVAAVVAGALLALAGVSGAGPAVLPYPQPGKPIQLLVGLAAGGSLDAQARVLAQKVTEQTGAQVIVVNRPGASMVLAATDVAHAAPDGYTLLYAPSSTLVQAPHTLLNLPYDPFRDFTPITLAARGPLVLTLHASVPAHDVRELVAWARTRSSPLNFASFGVGTSSHVYAEAFAKAAGIAIVHVPYKGSADAARDLLEGRVQAFFDAAPTALINEQTGRIRILGIAAPSRNPLLPNVPTLGEQGVPGLELTSWIAVLGPARMPPQLVARVNAVFVQALSSDGVHAAIARGAYETAPSTPAELAAEMRSSYERWGAMIRRIGFQRQ